MRRAPIVLTTTIVGTAAVLTFKPRHPDLSTSATASTAPADPSSVPSGSGSAGGSSAPGSPSSGGAGAASPSGTQTAIGDAVDTVYGAAQVKVTVTDGTITKVEAVQLQDAEPKSVEISNYAAPLLAQSALDKQSGDIDAVSGATYTSQSYEASLQSALDKLGFSAADGSKGSAATGTLTEGGRPHYDRGGFGDDGEGDGGRFGAPPPGSAEGGFSSG